MREINAHIGRIQRRVEASMLPQTAEIVIQSVGFNAAGMRTKTPARRLIYKGTSDIPVRLDVSKHYRQANVEGQEVNVSEFTVHMPRGVEPPLDSRIVVDGVAFETRKLLEQQAWDVTTQALLVRVNHPTLTLPVDALTDGDDGYLVTGEGDRILIG